MAHDPELAAKLERALSARAEISEKRMMGGICYFVNGNMIGGADRAKDGTRRFMFRIGKENSGQAERIGGGEPMIQGDRVMPGFFFVDADCCDDARLWQWVELALAFAKSLPAK